MFVLFHFFIEEGLFLIILKLVYAILAKIQEAQTLETEILFVKSREGALEFEKLQP